MADFGVVVHIAEKRGQRGGNILPADVGNQVIHQAFQPRQLDRLHLFHQGVNIGIVEIKGAAADPGKLGQFPHRDLPQAFLLQQMDQGFVQSLLGLAHTSVGISLSVHCAHHLPAYLYS